MHVICQSLSTMVTATTRRGSAVHRFLDSPSAKPYLDRMAFSEGYKLLYCIALGYPDETPDAKPRREDMIRFME